MIVIRPSESGDRDFILATWLRSYQRYSPVTNRIPKSIFFKFHQTLIKRILNNVDVDIAVAADKEDPRVILGYAVGHPEGGILHWVYVKKNFRSAGVAERLIESRGYLAHQALYCTHYTFALDDFKQKNIEIIFNPYLLEAI